MHIALRRKLMRARTAAREVLIPSERRHVAVRRRLAGRYLKGDGIEIGALYLPLRLPRGAAVRYVDRLSLPELRAHYPELAEYELVTPDIVDDGERLESIADASTDFVVANHLIEHCQDPIGTLSAYTRVLRDGGILYLAAPDRRRSRFDRKRAETTLQHLVDDHAHGPEGSRATHYDEWARLGIDVPADEALSRARALEADGYSIHFHTFTLTSFLGLLLHCRAAYGIPLEVLAAETNDHEFIVVAQKNAALGAERPEMSAGRGSSRPLWPFVVYDN
jgi:SAM-dependent methyltransferase